MQQKRKSNASRTRDTQNALVKAARALFLENGFAQASTPEIVKKAGVTRGALYHHFPDKQALFAAVVEAEASALAAEIKTSAVSANNSRDALLEGTRAYFAAMRTPGRAHLLLVEGPSVLGAQEMRRIDLEAGGQELRLGIEAALGPNTPPEEINARADLISAMFDRAILASDTREQEEVYQKTLADLLLWLCAAQEQPT